MARSRLIKPAFFLNEHLAELPFETRLLFSGLWTIADRSGRLEDRPKRIKTAIFPYDDVDVDVCLNQLAGAGEPFIFRYEHDGNRLIQIVNFTKHQHVHHRETESVLPEYVPNNGKSQASPGQAPGAPQSSPSLTLNPLTLNLNTCMPSMPGRARKNGKPDAIEFETFWQAYPKRRGRKVGKAQAKSVWSMLDAGAKLDSITAATNYATACDSDQTIAKDASRFLQAGYWRDWLEEPETKSRVATAEDLKRWNPLDGGLGDDA